MKVNREELPGDAEFKGYEEVVVRDLVVKSDNVRFRKEKFYAASTQKSYEVEMPCGYEGQFGPGVKSLVPALYFGMGMSEPKIHEFLTNMGLQISEGEVSNLLIKEKDEFHAEKEAVYEAGLKSTPYQHVDDTLTRVDGENQHCHIVCNPVYPIYYTLPNKDRLSVLDVLRNMRPRGFRMNGEALGYLKNIQLSQATRQILQTWGSEIDMDEATFQE